MTEKTIATFDVTSQEGMIKAFNGKNATNGSLGDLRDTTFTIEDIMLHDDVDGKTGEIKPITVIYTDKGVYGGNSSVARKSANDIIDLIKMGVEPNATIISGKSKGGQEFFNIQLV